MNSSMYPATSGRADPGRSRAHCRLNGLIAVFVIVTLCLVGCGRREERSASKPALAPRHSEAQLERLFHAAGESALSIEDLEGFKQIKPVQNVHLTAESEGLKIEATNNDPSVHLPEFTGGHDIVEVVVESPATTEMQLFYLLPGQKSFTEPQSEKRPLRSGHNVVYFELPDPAWTGVLRLDPGMMPGVYLIRSIKAKTAPAAGTK